MKQERADDDARSNTKHRAAFNRAPRLLALLVLISLFGFFLSSCADLAQSVENRIDSRIDEAIRIADQAVVLANQAAEENKARSPQALGETRTESRAIELVGAKSARIEIEIPLGDLSVRSGNDKLLVGIFAYNFAPLAPEIQYRVDGTKGFLVVRPTEDRNPVNPPTRGNFSPDLRTRLENNWSLALASVIPLDLTIRSGLGKTEIVTTGLEVGRLDVEKGVGDLLLDLRGDHSRDLVGNIKAGVGEVTVIVPQGTGARIETKNGLGEIRAEGLSRFGSVYTNGSFGATRTSIQIAIEAGVGNVTLREGE